jgi:hypothetical protein
MNIASRHTAAITAVLTASALSALTVSPSQGSIPDPDPIGHEATNPSPESTPAAPTQERPCFTWRSNWNASLDGPEPTCPLTPRP